MPNSFSRRSNGRRILFVTQFLPRDPAICGAEVRARNILKSLSDIGAVDVLLLCDSSTKQELSSASIRELQFARIVDVGPMRPRGLRSTLSWTFDAKSPYPQGIGVDQNAMLEVRRMLPEYDLVWFFRSYAADMFPAWDWARSVVDIDDVPSTFYSASSRQQSNPLRRLNDQRRQLIWTRRERLFDRRFTVLAVCTEEDRSHLAGLKLRYLFMSYQMDSKLRNQNQRELSAIRRKSDSLAGSVICPIVKV